MGSVTEALVHTEKPRIDNWGDGILVAEHLLNQAELNHCIVTADVYSILKDRYLYRPAGSFYIENKETNEQRYITIYYLLGRLIGDNIFKGRNSLPKIIRPISFYSMASPKQNRMSTISERNNIIDTNYRRVISPRSNIRSNVSTDSGNSSSTNRNLENVLKNVNQVDEVTKQRENCKSSKCILLTQDMLAGIQQQPCRSPINENSSSSESKKINSNSKLHSFIEKNVIEEEDDNKINNSESHNEGPNDKAPIVYPETWMDAEDFNESEVYDAESQQLEETFIDCDDDVINLEEFENLNLEEDIDAANKCEKILFDYFSNYENETFLKEWLDEQYNLLLKNFNDQEEQEVDKNLNDFSESKQEVELGQKTLSPKKNNKQNEQASCHQRELQPQNRVNNYYHKRPVKSKQADNNYSSTASSNPSSPLFYQKRYRHTRNSTGVSNVNNNNNNRRNIPKKHLINVNQETKLKQQRNSHYQNNMTTTSNTSDGEISNSSFKLSPIDLEELIRHYKTSTDHFSSVDDGDDESGNDQGAQNMFLRQMKLRNLKNYDSDASSSTNALHIEEKKQIKNDGLYISEKESPPKLDKPLRGKALLNEYINLRSSLNYQCTSSAASMSSNQSSAKCFNDRARSLSFKSRYYAWLLRSSANSLANGNKSKANKIILDALISDSNGLLNKHSRNASSSRGCDSEYDNYKPGLTSDEDQLLKVKQNLFLKKTFWSTDDDEDLIGKRKSESLVGEKKKLPAHQIINSAAVVDIQQNENETSDEDEDTCRLVSASTCKDMSTITERTEQISMHEADSFIN